MFFSFPYCSLFQLWLIFIIDLGAERGQLLKLATVACQPYDYDITGQ